jgi:hypothetical protein
MRIWRAVGHEDGPAATTEGEQIPTLPLKSHLYRRIRAEAAVMPKAPDHGENGVTDF